MLNYFYSDTINSFIEKSPETIIGEISIKDRLGYIETQLFAWESQIQILKESLSHFSGHLFFEFSIPRMGKRVDCILIIENIVFVIEFKVGESTFYRQDIEQVWDYALDLKNFHKPSHDLILVPVLVATQAKESKFNFILSEDKLADPILCNSKELKSILIQILKFYGSSKEKINPKEYISGSYTPTPTIIEAAVRFYNDHNVDEITRNDADAINLKHTTSFISETIYYAKENHKKVICFVTGVPGAGKTLVGLKVATEHLDNNGETTSVFLSGNKPLVDVLQEALVRDKVRQEKEKGNRITKKKARESVKAFIQMIHHYRDEYIRDPKPPFDHVAIFDEAQRAWTKEQTVTFMHRKKNLPNFQYSEPEFLISCLDRHEDWAVVICLVGGGQEINTGEAGIAEWLRAVKNSFPSWETRISPHLYDSEYDAQESIKELQETHLVNFHKHLHLSVSMRSYRAEYLSRLVKEILDLDPNAQNTFNKISSKYPIVLTRDINQAKKWLRSKARGSERYGMVVSSQAYRLKPLAIDVRAKIDHVKWFLEDKDDIRSSFFLEDAATEFQVQGLELDWVGVTWDGDLRYSEKGWKTFSFRGNKWQNIRQEIRKQYLINAYRVLLTRARQGMVIVIPKGSQDDHTRKPDYYDSTFNYLKDIGFPTII